MAFAGREINNRDSGCCKGSNAIKENSFDDLFCALKLEWFKAEGLIARIEKKESKFYRCETLQMASNDWQVNRQGNKDSCMYVIKLTELMETAWYLSHKNFNFLTFILWHSFMTWHRSSSTSWKFQFEFKEGIRSDLRS